MDKIKTISLKISLINNSGNTHNYPTNYTLSITDSGANIHLSNKYTPTMAPATIPNNIYRKANRGHHHKAVTYG